MGKRKIMSELAALNEEARTRHVTYGLLMARTTPEERVKIVEKWRKHFASTRRDDEMVTERTELRQRFAELYDMGLTDSAIAAECGCSVGKVSYWRTERKLTANRFRGKRDDG